MNNIVILLNWNSTLRTLEELLAYSLLIKLLKKYDLRVKVSIIFDF